MDPSAAKSNLHSLVGEIRSREDFVAFAEALLRDLRDNPHAWENRELASFLEALAAWTEGMDAYYKHIAEPMPTQPTWKMFGEILLAARIYE